MNEVNINKYLSQFNPILIVPVLSAVVGAILVFVFGFKRPNEPRFQSSSSIDSIKKSKRKTNPTKTSDNISSKQQIVSSAKVAAGKKTTDTLVAVASKKGSIIEKSNSNNNNTSNSNNNGHKKKTDEKKSENGSPTKKVSNKKTGKESTNLVTKKSKTNKNISLNGTEFGEKPADFDDDGWFTVQSKSTKQKNKIDDSTANQTENSPPKVQSTKNNKAAKSSKVEKQSIAQANSNELNSASEILLPESNVEHQSSIDQPFNVAKNEVAETAAPEIDEEPAVVATNDVIVQPVTEKKPTASVPLDVADTVAQSAIAFDELGEWTDAKPDRKRVNKKKSRKD